MFYCPYCGEENFETGTICRRCRNVMTPIKTIHEFDYYRDKSIERYGTNMRIRDIIIEEEVSKNPLYDPSLKDYEPTREENFAVIEEFKKKNQPPKPKCPTCGSTNIQKISDLRKAGGAIMFGLFSTTARSQFECKNCGMKF